MSGLFEEETKKEAREYLKNKKFTVAESLFARILLSNPNCVESLSSLGIINIHNKKFDFAKHFFQKALTLEENNHILHFNLGFVSQQLNEIDEAINHYKNSINIKENVMSFNNLAFIFWSNNKKELAIKTLKDCINFEEHLSVIANLSNFLLITGDNIDALDVSSLALKPDKKFSLAPLVTFCNAMNRLKENQYPKKNKEVLESLEHILTLGSEKPILNANFIKLIFKDFYNESIFKKINLKKGDNLDAKLISNLIDQDPSIFNDKDFIKLLTSNLIFHYISKNIISDKYLENIYSKLRLFFLEKSFEEEKLIDASIDRFLCALSLQCEFNGYIWNVEKEEENLLKKITSENKITLHQAIIFTCYKHIGENKNILSILKKNTNEILEINEILNIHFGLPKRLIKESKNIKSLGAIDDPISVKVRDQYENYPYPLWKSQFYKGSNEFTTKVSYSSEILDNIDRSGKKEILVAGCGTGREALSIATIYSNSKISAVDLSLKSLAYGSMKAKNDQIENIEFIHSDILKLSSLEKSFDIISSCGVLHHMESPHKGLKILTSLLNDNGLIKIALYSSFARESLKEIKEFIKKNNLTNSNQDIKELRKLIKNKEIAVHENYIDDIERSVDFYSINELRDLLFHPQEINYNLVEINQMLSDCGLKFLEFDNKYLDLKKYYQSIYPDDKTGSNLFNWNEIEKKQKLIFSAMYVFWAAKK